MAIRTSALDDIEVYTRDRWGRYWRLGDAYGAVFSTGENGFKLASWNLDRAFSFAWEDLSLNSQVYFMNNRGDVAWHGRVESIQLQIAGGSTHLACVATGYWASLYDSFYTGILATSTTPEAMIALLIPGMTQLANDSTGLIVTGLTGQGYQTPDGGTTYVRPGDVILAICALGTSTTGDRVIPMVLSGRKLITRRLPLTPVPAYSVSRSNLETISLQRSLSSIWNRVQVRYKSNADGSLQTNLVEDTAQQAALGIDFTGSAGVTRLVRVTLRDITGLTDTTSTVADTMANAILNLTKRARNEPQAITISRDRVVLDKAAGAEIPNWAVQAGNWLQVPDLFDRASDPADIAVGQSLGDEALQTMFYVSETSYSIETGVLTITPGAGSVLSEGI